LKNKKVDVSGDTVYINFALNVSKTDDTSTDAHRQRQLSVKLYVQSKHKHAAIKFSSQGQRSRLNKPTFTWLIEPNETRYCMYTTASKILRVVSNL